MKFVYITKMLTLIADSGYVENKIIKVYRVLTIDCKFFSKNPLLKSSY